MTVERLLLAYVALLLAAVAVIAVYYELRRRSFGPTATEDNIFRCGDCGYVYTDDADVDLSRCPQCGRMNEVFEF